MYIKILQYPWNMALHKLSVNYDIVKGRGEVKYLAERADIIKIILRIQFCASLPVSFPFPSPCLTSCLSPASLNCQHTCTFLMVMAKPQCQLERKVTFHGWCNWRRVFLRSRGGSAFWESLRTLAYSKVTYLGYWIIFEKKILDRASIFIVALPHIVRDWVSGQNKIGCQAEVGYELQAKESCR